MELGDWIIFAFILIAVGIACIDRRRHSKPDIDHYVRMQQLHVKSWQRRTDPVWQHRGEL